MKKVMAAVLAGIMMFSMAACGKGTPASSDAGSAGVPAQNESAGNDASGSQTTADGQKTIGIILKTLNSEYWSCMVAGIRQAEKDFGVNVILQGPASETSFDEQMAMIETMLSAGEAQAMVIAPLQPDMVAGKIADAKVPVLAVDTKIPSDKVISYVGVGNESAAYEGGKYVAQKLGDQAKVIIIAGVQGDLTSEDRVNGFRKGVEENGGEVLSVQYSDAATDKAVSVMESMIQLYGDDIGAVLCHSDDVAMGAARACESSGFEQIVVCGFGGISGAKPIEQGQIACSVAIGPYEMGYQAVEKAIDAIDGKPVEVFIDTGATILDKDNVADFLVKLADWTK